MIKVVIDDLVTGKAPETDRFENKKREVQKEINSYPLSIDRKWFQKTKEEKELVNNLKVRWKNKNKVTNNS